MCSLSLGSPPEGALRAVTSMRNPLPVHVPFQPSRPPGGCPVKLKLPGPISSPFSQAALAGPASAGVHDCALVCRTVLQHSHQSENTFSLATPQAPTVDQSVPRADAISSKVSGSIEPMQSWKSEGLVCAWDLKEQHAYSMASRAYRDIQSGPETASEQRTLQTAAKLQSANGTIPDLRHVHGPETTGKQGRAPAGCLQTGGEVHLPVPSPVCEAQDVFETAPDLLGLHETDVMFADGLSGSSRGVELLDTASEASELDSLDGFQSMFGTCLNLPQLPALNERPVGAGSEANGASQIQDLKARHPQEGPSAIQSLADTGVAKQLGLLETCQPSMPGVHDMPGSCIHPSAFDDHSSAVQ